MRELLGELEAAPQPSPKRPRRALTLGIAATLAGVLGVGLLMIARKGTDRAASESSTALHAACGGASSGSCPSPLVCRYPEGNHCGASDRAGTCHWPIDGCDAKSTKVCGCDGVSYVNQCEANRHGAAAAYRGACVPCQAAAACADVTAGGVRTATFCHVAEGASASEGVCWPRPSACDEGGPPVCGWDGRTYPSACEARRAGFDAQHSGACASDVVGAPSSASVDASTPGGLTFGPPDAVGVDARPLLRLVEWIETEKLPIYSLLISKDGVVFFELYTSSLDRDAARYLMAVTDAVTSALMGVAIDRHLVRAPETAVADALPPALFPSERVRAAFRRVTILDLLDRSALDAPVPPHYDSEAAKERQRRFLASPNRTAFALTEPLLPDPGTSYQGTPLTTQIAAGILAYATHGTLLELAESALFGPMEFRSYEWMYQDQSGIEMGDYGLRLRPVDMQKLGVLFLRQGVWNGRRLLSSEWALRTFSPTIRTSAGHRAPNYGLGFWTVDFGAPEGAAKPKGHPWIAHVADGWKGQRIAVFPDQGVVVTMTAALEPPEDESAIFRRIVREDVMAAVDGTGAAPARPDPNLRSALIAKLEAIRTAPASWKPPPEWMAPSVPPKDRHRAFDPK